MKQLHDRKCFELIKDESLTAIEKKRALESLIFLTEKKDGAIKAQHCTNWSPQKEWMTQEEVSSPTVSTKLTPLTAVIEAEEGRDVATCDIPNAFIQTQVEERDEDGNQNIMKIRRILVDILCELYPIYKDYVVYEKDQKVLCVHIMKAIYGPLVSAMLYDPCVANKQVEGKQMTISWLVDDLKISHASSKIVDDSRANLFGGNRSSFCPGSYSYFSWFIWWANFVSQ